ATPKNGWQDRWFHLVMWAVIFVLVIGFLRAVQPILLPFVLGILVAYLMNPLASTLQRTGLNRTLATAVIALGLLALIVGLSVWLAPLLY
ncbi:AI-2E family transporter, partial [Klebsiella pneumoniae]|uniref:AI-2E family transporter n=1 Tax=Klebsiella pneumoniae TaxID=573 RepID=UPI003B985E92